MASKTEEKYLEKLVRCKLAAACQLLDLFKLTGDGIHNIVTACLDPDERIFLVNPYGFLYYEITASSFHKVDSAGAFIKQGSLGSGVSKSLFAMHRAIHESRQDLRYIIQVTHTAVVAISSLEDDLLPLSRDSVVVGKIARYTFFKGDYNVILPKS